MKFYVPGGDAAVLAGILWHAKLTCRIRHSSLAVKFVVTHHRLGYRHAQQSSNVTTADADRTQQVLYLCTHTDTHTL